MKATLEFNLDDLDDSHSYYQTNRASDMASALWEIMYNTKKKLESELEEGLKLSAYDMLNKTYEEFYNVLQEWDLNIDKLNR